MCAWSPSGGASSIDAGLRRADDERSGGGMKVTEDGGHLLAGTGQEHREGRWRIVGTGAARWRGSSDGPLVAVGQRKLRTLAVLVVERP